MTHDDLFLATLDDLRSRLAPPVSGYDRLQVAAILRRLIIDGHNLIHAVNRDRQTQVRFRVVDDVLPEALRFEGFQSNLVATGLLPEVKTGVTPIDATLEQLGRVRVGVIRDGDGIDHEITVRELVKHTANVKGGVHIGAPRTTKEELLSDLGERTVFAGALEPSQVLGALGVIVLRGLAELEERVRDTTRQPPPR